MFSAVQDIAVDGIALHVLPDEQLGLGNTIQVQNIDFFFFYMFFYVFHFTSLSFSFSQSFKLQF